MNQEYNLLKMCCRIRTSGRGARTIVGLYIFLATFLIGFIAVNGSFWLGTIGLSESEVSRSWASVQAPYEADLCRNTYGIVISRRHWVPDGKAEEVIFDVSNIGSETIYLEHDTLGVDYWKLGAGPYSFTRTSAVFSESVDRKPFLVGDVFWIPNEPQFKIRVGEIIPFSFTPNEDFESAVSLEFRTSENEPYREITAHFERNESLPDTCYLYSD